MRAVVQRVSEASVRVGDETVGACSEGLMILLGVASGDRVDDARRLAGRVARLRVFPDGDGRFDRSLLDTGGGALVVSQFTLVADTSRGNRPSFTAAAPPDVAEPLYEHFCNALADEGVSVQCGVFGASMKVALINDGPVTVILETAGG